MKIILSIIVIIIFCSCNDNTGFSSHKFAIKCTSGDITSDKAKKIVENDSFLAPCSKDMTYSYDIFTEYSKVKYIKYINTGNHDLYLITIMGGHPQMSSWGIRKEDNSIIGGDDTYMAYPPDYIPCIIKLIPKGEYYLFENEAFGPRPDVYHSVFKIFYFDTKDSSFVSGWIGGQDKKYYKSEEEYLIDHKNLIDPVRYEEFITFMEEHKKNEIMIQKDSVGQVGILRLIREFNK